MDYKEKYNKALEIAKDYHDKGGAPLILEVIFPELKQSEEEWIKDNIKGAIQAVIIPKESKRKMLAWLEKQGDSVHLLDPDKVIAWLENRHRITPNGVCYCLSKDDIKEFKKDFGL